MTNRRVFSWGLHGTLVVGIGTMMATNTWAAPASGPQILAKWGRYHTQIDAYMPNPYAQAPKKVKWLPKLRVVVKMKAPESDDRLVVQFKKGGASWGKTVMCPPSSTIARRDRRGRAMGYSLVIFNCTLPKKNAIARAGSFAAVVGYKETAKGKTHKKMATYKFKVKTFNVNWPSRRRPTKGYYVDHDFRLGEAWLYRPTSGKIELWTWFKYDLAGAAAVRNGRMRCYLGDTKVPFLDHPTRRQEVQFQNYLNGKGKKKRTTWGLWYWSSARVGEVLTSDWLNTHPGKYRCVLTQKGNISREFFFEVGKDGKLVKPPCQRGGVAAKVGTVADETLIKMVVKKSADLKYNKAAFKKGGLYGLKVGKLCKL